MEQINEKIRDMEFQILEIQDKIAEAKKTRDIAILNKCNELETKYKETKDKSLSTVEKRKIVAEKEEAIAKHIKDIKTMEYELETMKIERDYNKRKIKIGTNENLYLKSISEALNKIANQGFPQ